MLLRISPQFAVALLDKTEPRTRVSFCCPCTPRNFRSSYKGTGVWRKRRSDVPPMGGDRPTIFYSSALPKHESRKKFSRVSKFSKMPKPKYAGEIVKKIQSSKSEEEILQILDGMEMNLKEKENKSNFHFILQQQKAVWKALVIFGWMKENLNDSIIHDSSSYAFLFNLLVKSRELDRIQPIWSFVSSSNFAIEPFVLDTLVKSCSENGRGDLAMHWVDVMCQSGMLPSEHAAYSLMKCLCWNKNLENATKIMEIAEKANYKNTEIYNCFMKLYCHFGMSKEAQALLAKMKRLGIVFDSYTLSEAISATGNGGDVEIAEEIFANLYKEYRVQPCVITYTSLISVLGRNGQVQTSLDLFQEMKMKGIKADVAVYNSMITLMGRQSRLEGAENLFEEMQEIGLKPNLRTFNALIHMYGKEKELIKMAYVLNMMKQLSFQIDQDFIDLVLGMCSQSSNVNDIKVVLQEIYSFSNINLSYVKRKMIAWFKSEKFNELHNFFSTNKREINSTPNTKSKERAKQPNSEKSVKEVVNELKNSDKWEEAIAAFEKVSPLKSKMKSHRNEALICTMIEVYGRQDMIFSAEKLFNEIFDHGKPPDLQSFNTLMNVYAERGMIKEVNRLFQKMTRFQRVPDTLTFTIMLKAYSKGEKEKEKDCLGVYKSMLDQNCKLDEVAYNTIINVCGKYLQLLEVQDLFKEMKLKKFAPNTITYNTMISLYVKSNRMMDAEEVLNEAIVRGVADSISYSILINGYGKKRQLDRMEKWMNNIVSSHTSLSTSAFNAMIDAYGKSGFYKSMENVFDRMISLNLTPDLTTFNTMIHAYGDGGKLVEMEETVESMKEAGLLPDIWTYNILIGAYGNMGMPYASVKALRDMQGVGLVPDAVTYNNLILAFEHAGDYLEAARWSLWRKQAGY